MCSLRSPNKTMSVMTLFQKKFHDLKCMKYNYISVYIVNHNIHVYQQNNYSSQFLQNCLKFSITWLWKRTLNSTCTDTFERVRCAAVKVVCFPVSLWRHHTRLSGASTSCLSHCKTSNDWVSAKEIIGLITQSEGREGRGKCGLFEKHNVDVTNVTNPKIGTEIYGIEPI